MFLVGIIYYMDASARAPERIRTNGGVCTQANTCTGLGVCARMRTMHTGAQVCTRARMHPPERTTPP